MLGNDQIEALAERLLRRVTKQCSRGAVPPDDFARAVCINDSICDLVDDSVSQLALVFHGHFFPSEAVGLRAIQRRHGRPSDLRAKAQICFVACLRSNGALRMRVAAEGPAAVSRLSYFAARSSNR